MNSKELHARQALILNLISGFPYLAGKATAGLISAYVDATEDVPVDALRAACRDFAEGTVSGHNAEFMPAAPQLAVRARLRADLTRKSGADRMVSYPIGELPPPPMVAGGILRIEVDGRLQDVTRWTNAEQDEALRTGRTPETVKARLAGAESVTPRLQRI